MKTYWDYVGGYFGGMCFMFLTNLSMVFFTFFGISADYVIGDWTSQKD